MKLINLFLRYFREKYSFLKQGNFVIFYKFDISENNQEIVSKSGLMASRLGSRRRAETDPVGGLNEWGMRGGSTFSPTLYQGLSSQGSF